MQRNRNRMEKTSDLFKKTRDIKGILHAMMGMIGNRNSKGLREGEKIKNWQEYTEEFCKKGPNDLDNHNIGLLT